MVRWGVLVGGLLNQQSLAKLNELHSEILEYRERLKRSPDTLDDLKFVLETISDIHAHSMEVELRYRDIEERYRTLALYRIPVPDEEGTHTHI